MSIYEDPTAQAADLHNIAQTGDSFLSDTSDFLTKGVPLAVGSGLVSMYNTGVSLGNVLGGDFDKVNYEDEVKDYDDDLGKYYTEHKTGIDLGGFLATSFIPGLGGIKALKLIQGGLMGKSAAAATGFFRDAEERYLGKALSSIQQETNQVFKQLDGNKLAAIAAGAGDQALQGAAFETATLLTMNQNPELNQDDVGYFRSLIHNSPEILSAALFGGVVGGGVEALGTSGKLKSAIRARDKEDFPSLNIKELGLSDLDPGTAASTDFAWLKSRERYYTEAAANGDLNERELQNYKRTQQQKATELLTRVRETLTDKDAELSKAVWNHLIGITSDGDESAENVGIRLLGAASKIDRITEADSAQLGQKILYEDGFLSERHAKNILLRGKIAPEPINPQDSEAVEMAAMQGNELYKDEAGNLRVIPGTKYAKSTLKVQKDTAEHDLIVKVAGDRNGQVTESAYPTLGDTGKVTMEKGILKVDGQPYIVKDYDPINNTPLQSNAKFLQEKLTPKLAEDAEEGEAGSAEITDLPKLEKAYLDGTSLDVYEDGEHLGNMEENPELLLQAKLQMRQELINAGHDFGRIARELNVTQDFAETARGDYTLRMEDHTQPQYAKIAYNTKLLPDKFYLRGTVDLMQRVQLAKEHNLKVAALILGPAFNELPVTGGTMLGINTIPELGNFVKSADEMYGSFGELMQSVGKIADREFRQRSSAVMSRISASHRAILEDPKSLQDFNLLIAKIRSAKEPLVLEDDGTLIPQSITKLKPEDQEAAIEAALNDKSAFTIDNPDHLQYLKTTQEINATRADLMNHYFAAKGDKTSFDPEVMYVPPINTRKYPFVAFVKESAENNFRPTSVITASTPEDLEAKIRAIRQGFGDTLNVYTKDDLANFYKMQGEYESGLLLGNSSVDNSMKKRGILSDFAPRTDKQILDDFVDWHIQSEQSLVRNAIELNYGQEFAELRSMGQTFFEYQKSKFGREFTDKEYAQMRKDNPYEKYISTALATSNYAKYDSVWGKINSAVESLGQSMFKAWDSAFSDATKGKVDWIEANNQAEQLGFRAPYRDVLREVINPYVSDRKVVEPLIGRINSALATLVLRLDPLNSIVNIFGTPGLMAAELASIRRNITNPDVVGKLSALTSTAVPGSDIQMPSTLKLMHQAITNFIMDDGTLLKRYQSIGAVQSDLQLYRNVLDASQLTDDVLKGGSDGLVQWGKNVVDKTTQLGATLSGNNLSERMVRFIAADTMRQLGEAASVPEGELNAYINTFVNRVHGNYTASQRPHVFQGAVGHAIGLFQTFQFNVMQNMVRFVETNDKTAIAALLGLQNTIFGLQGNPAFYLLNSAIGNANREHKDLVTGAYATVGQDAANWLMYGLGSNALKTNLYNRGDLTPRYATVLPTNVQDIPAVSLPAKFFASVYDTVKSIAKGAPVGDSILEGLAHNGVSRPLAGVAQLAQGYRTTAQGNLLIAYNEKDTMLAAAKIFGGESLNNSLAIDQYYRQLAYKKQDVQNIQSMGEPLKIKIRSGQPLTEDDTTNFMRQYSAAGGNVSTFNRFLAGQYKAANVSQIAKMKGSLQSPFGRNLGAVMGAESDEDLYRQSPAGIAESGNQ